MIFAQLKKMNVLIKKAVIVCSTSPAHLQVKDILIIDGFIKTIDDNLVTIIDTTEINIPNLHVSIGWIDIFADFAEPGYEYKETLETGANAAAAGGYTDVMLLPNTSPTIDNKSQVEFVIQRAKNFPINILPIGAITKNTDGQALAEMYDMYQSGAVAFSDGRKSVQQSGILLKALQYVAAKNATIIQLANDKTISDGGLMNEGIESTKLGLPGIPTIAEEVMIARDIAVLQYTDSKLHCTAITTQKSVSLINEAKKQGLQITCSVTPYHLVFCDEDMNSYDTNLKVNPPLRTRADMEALQQALINGDIDCIASHHTPQSWDDKTIEFEYAKNGMITLQTTFATVNQILQNTEAVVNLFTNNARNIFNIPMPIFAEGELACLTMFNPNEEFIFKDEAILSASKNSAFIGKKLQGKVYGILHKNQMVLNK